MMQTVVKDNSRLWNTIWLIVAAFLCYTGMYAVRKSFLAGQYADVNLQAMHFKTVLVISQILGYMLSKFIGIKVISEMKKSVRSKFLISFVGFGLLMLLVFAIVPPPFKLVALFFNGLPLGMVFGIVLSYLEGRKNTELLAAGLSATFIFSTGFVKTTGVWLMQKFGVPELMMPFSTGLLFFPVFIFAVWMLNKSNPPTAEDIAQRTERQPMSKANRKNFLKLYGLGFAGLVIIYILLTIVRDFRDNFIVEFWQELGYGEQPAMITLTEIPIAIVVLLISAAGILIHSNRVAFQSGMAITIFCGMGMLLTTLLFQHGIIGPVFWIIGTGMTVYLPYILFHTLLFERLLAMLKFNGTIGFLFYVADALGYAGSVVILLVKEFANIVLSWVEFFEQLNIYASIAIVVFCTLTMMVIKKEHKKIALVNLGVDRNKIEN